jgi:hypothetical protein
MLRRQLHRHQLATQRFKSNFRLEIRAIPSPFPVIGFILLRANRV